MKESKITGASILKVLISVLIMVIILLGVYVFSNQVDNAALAGAAVMPREIRDGTIVFTSSQLRYEGDAVRSNNSIILSPGASVLGPNVPMEAGVWTVVIYGQNLSGNDELTVGTFDILNIEVTEATLAFELNLPENIPNLEIFYKNNSDVDVVIRRITFEKE